MPNRIARRRARRVSVCSFPALTGMPTERFKSPSQRSVKPAMPSPSSSLRARGYQSPRGLCARGRVNRRASWTRAARCVRSGLGEQLLQGQLQISAGVAQLVERQPSKLNVASSSLVSRSVLFLVPGRPNPGTRDVSGGGCPNPRHIFLVRGCPNPRTGDVEGRERISSRSDFQVLRSVGGGGLEGSPRESYPAHLAQLVEHVLGKDEVTSSILVVGSKRMFRTWSCQSAGARSASARSNDQLQGECGESRAVFHN